MTTTQSFFSYARSHLKDNINWNTLLLLLMRSQWKEKQQITIWEFKFLKTILWLVSYQKKDTFYVGFCTKHIVQGAQKNLWVPNILIFNENHKTPWNCKNEFKHRYCGSRYVHCIRWFNSRQWNHKFQYNG